MKPRQNASIYSANLKNYFKLAETRKSIFLDLFGIFKICEWAYTYERMKYPPTKISALT